MSGSPARRPCVEDLVGTYRADLVAAGMFAGHPVTSVARMFFTRVGAAGWAQMPLADQCALPLKDRRVVGWLIVTGRLRPSPDYLVACRPYLGEVAAHHHRAFHVRFAETSAGLGFGATVTRLQWSALAKVTALAGLAPDQVTQAVIDEGRQALTAAIGRHHPGSHGPGALSAALFGLQTTLFHLGALDAAPRKTSPDRSAERAAQWASAAPQLASTLAGYIAQVSLSLRASTMVRVEGVLREFACWLAGNAPEVACVAGLRRRHIEAYKLHLAARPSARGGKLSRISLAEHLGALRACFERLTEWDGDDVPAAVLVFSGDLPLRDEPLPRFLDDGAFTKLLQATRADPDPFVRLAVEFLARTGLLLPGSPAVAQVWSSCLRSSEADGMTLACATGVAQASYAACHLWRGVALSWAMSSRLAARAAARSWSRSSSWRRRSMACCSRWVTVWLRASMSAGTPSPDSRQACSPSASDRRFSS